MVERLALRGHGHEESVALLVDPNTNGSGDIGLNLVGSLAAGRAILKRSQAVAVNGSIHISGVGIETLADQQTRFAVRFLPGAWPVDAGRQDNIPRHALPDEVKRVFLTPHVLAATGDQIRFSLPIIFDRAGMARISHVRVVFKQPQAIGFKCNPRSRQNWSPVPRYGAEQ